MQTRQSIGHAAAVTALLLLLTTLPASSQVLRGRVLVGETHAPVTDAVVMIFAGTAIVAAVESDSLGTFEVELPAPGEYTLTASRGGYVEIGPATFTSSADRVLDVTLTMSNTVFTLDPLSVNAAPRMSVEGSRRRSELNRRLGIGAHMNRDEIRNSRRLETGDLLTSMVAQVEYGDTRPSMIASGTGPRTRYTPVQGSAPERLVGVTRQGRLCPLALFVDGASVGRGDAAVLPHPDEIDTVEVYLGSNAHSGFYDVAGCGIALITTGRTHAVPGYRRTLLGSSILAAMLGIVLVAH